MKRRYHLKKYNNQRKNKQFSMQKHDVSEVIRAMFFVNIEQLSVRKIFPNKTICDNKKQCYVNGKGCCDEPIYWTAVRRRAFFLSR